ncbi:MAG TPA: hypothetical protein VNX25_10720 [Verrucomicrobiae bacterium]|nr:hypothetical protein [Verrucomicrobiae bacterium]
MAAGIRLTAPQERALRFLIDCLDHAGACYQFSGGFAGNLHGSSWPLHDFDLDVAAADLPRLAPLLAPHTWHPLGPYQDEEFRLNLLRARICGVEVDVTEAETACGRSGGTWVPLGIDLDRRILLPVLDLQVWVQPLDALIAYKELIGREKDLLELRSLSPSPRP